MKNMMKMKLRKDLAGSAVAFGALIALTIPVSAYAQTAAAKPLFANVNADAQCTVTRSDVNVDAGLIQKDTPSSGPVVSTVVFSLEQHFPNQNDWKPVAGSTVSQTVNKQFALVLPGERYDVALNDYPVACSLISPAANAVRAVVQITVDNANPKRPGGLIHTGRCVSFANPCRP